MAAVYSKTLLRVHNYTGEAVAAPPAGTIWVVRDIAAYDGSLTGNNELEVQAVDADDTYAGFAGWVSPVLANGQWFHWEGRQVIDAGGELRIFVASGLDVSICGYELTLP